MADNSVLPGTGDTYASDDIGGVKFPRVKLIYGADGVNSGDVDGSNPLPVSVGSGVALIAPSGLRVTVPSLVSVAVPSLMSVGFATGIMDVRAGSGLQVLVPSLVNVGIATGLIGLQAPSGLALAGGSGALISLSNPLPAQLPSGFFLGITASGLPVTDANPLPVSSTPSPSGSLALTPSGIHISGGTGAPITLSNPMPTRVFTGAAFGALASGLPVTPQNPFQVALFGSGAAINHTNPMPVSIPSGVSVSISSVTVQGIDAHDSPLTAAPVTIGGFASAAAPTSVTDGDAVRGWFLNNGAAVSALQAAGALIAAGGGVSANALRVTAASDSLPWPTTQATGAPFAVFSRQATGTVHQITQATGAPFNVFAQQATGTVQNIAQATGAVLNVFSRQATGTVHTVAFPTGAVPGALPLVKIHSEEEHGFNPTGGPFLVGVQGQGIDPAPVASGAVARVYGDTQGRQVVTIGSPLSMRLRATAGLQGTGARTLIAAQGSGYAIAVTSIAAMNASPTFASRVVIHDGTATLFGGYASAQGGGFTHNGGTTPLFVATSNSALQAVNLATGADIDLNVSGYKVSTGSL